MTPELISLLVQVPLVGAFIVFTVFLLKSFNSSQRELQLATQEHEEQLNKQTTEFLADQNLKWQNILQIERERRKEAMDQGLREVEVLVKSIDKLTEALRIQTEHITRHDASSIERHREITRMLEEK